MPTFCATRDLLCSTTTKPQCASMVPFQSPFNPLSAIAPQSFSSQTSHETCAIIHYVTLDIRLFSVLAAFATSYNHNVDNRVTSFL